MNTRGDHSQTDLNLRSKRDSGFTLLELLITLVLIGIVTTLAMPAMKTVTRRGEALDIASSLVQQVNLARDQANRRNRSYQLIISDFNMVNPSGAITLSEGASNTCQSLVEKPDQLNTLVTKPYGGSVINGVESSIRPHVGLGGWRRSDADDWQTATLELCINPKGGTFVRSGALFSELIGHYSLAVQQFFGDPLRPLGPPYQVELTFSSGAKVKR
jgi:prepilin-type N-terminal cleavage/methylation domain-containing protein